MDCPWAIHGQSMDARGQFVGCSWTVQRLPMDNPWTVHVLFMNNPRIVHGQSRDCPWTIHLRSMGCL
eukprot:3856953-Lingulodinium_polyedra.AAC.1